jgi:uncharacterized repeat protein (TIGR02543 family)
MKVLALLVGAAALLAATSGQAQVPAGSYAQSCSNAQVAGNVLRARCRTMSGAVVDTTLNLPCAGSIDNINGKLTCTGAPAAGVPPGSYLQSCGNARVQDGTLNADCRRANQTVAQASLRLPCTGGKIDNLNGVLTCVGGSTPPPPPPSNTATLTVPRMTGGLIMTQGGTLAIWCGQDDGNNNANHCSVTQPKGSKLTIATYPMKGHGFGGWTGACSGTSQMCSVTLDADKSLGATFPSFDLTATAPSNGSISGAGLNCGTTCKLPQVPGSSQSVNANPALGYVFESWGGACAGKPNPCALTMDATKAVTVTFKSVATRKISATAPANGSIQGSGLSCGTTCSAPQTTGSKPSIVAAPATGYVFASWGGDCANQGQNCTLDMSADRTATATFRSVGTATLTVPRMTGGLIMTQGGTLAIWCGQDDGNNNANHCSTTVTNGTRLTIAAYPMNGKKLDAWSGACTGAAQMCTVVVDSNKTLGATFK